MSLFGSNPLRDFKKELLTRDRDYIAEQRDLVKKQGAAIAAARRKQLEQAKAITAVMGNMSYPIPPPYQRPVNTQFLSALMEQRFPQDEPLKFSFRTEPIVAHRLWTAVRFDTRHGTEKRLSPVTSAGGPCIHYPTFKRMEAFCSRQHHEAPDPQCYCGVWALKEEYVAEAVGYEYAVWGEVYLWGRVLEGTKGYRAQYAYPKHLKCADPKLAAELRSLYGVPVEVGERLKLKRKMVDVTTLGGTTTRIAAGPMQTTHPNSWLSGTANINITYK